MAPGVAVFQDGQDLVETPTGTQRPSIALTVSQVQCVLRAARGNWLEALRILGFVLGLRPGKLMGLLWEHIDFDTGVIWVSPRTSGDRTDARGRVMDRDRPRLHYRDRDADRPRQPAPGLPCRDE